MTMAALLQVINLIFLSVFLYFAIMWVVCECLQNSNIAKMRMSSIISFFALVIFFFITKL
ncbi:hypothetical protein WR164_04010 [Philodulcilactobacillus myokoensis]|uniref:Uncharacterized protein n=1 Tax=Philodulcilactobacillus myokoensis TaxID=2929573 RepID=A0A9W6B067_9LACO|nr:hypothetical protein [Philodulcilactobacillus myokoensis]GLB46422.1 hypothetical protein WR164_04010 [Philodulcilactobacillus myokoensis]